MTSLRSENPSIYVVEKDGRAIGRLRSPHEAMTYARRESIEEAERGLPESAFTIRELRYDNPRSENPSVWYYVERNGRAIGRFRSRHEAVAYEQEDRAKRKGRELPGGNEYRIMEVQDLRYDNPRKRELSVFDRHQLRVALDILRAPDAAVPFMGGGIDKEEAREIIRRLTGKGPGRKENPRYGPLTHVDDFESMEQARDAAQDAKTAKDSKGRPWYASVSVKDLGPEAGRLRYGLYYREVYHDNPSSEWHHARSAELALLADDMSDSPEDEEFLRRKSAEHLIQADIPSALHSHSLFAKSQDLSDAERAAHYESQIAEERIGGRVNPRLKNYKDPGPEWEFIGSVGTKAQAVIDAKRLSKSQFRQIKAIKNKTAGTWDLYGRTTSENPMGSDFRVDIIPIKHPQWDWEVKAQNIRDGRTRTDYASGGRVIAEAVARRLMHDLRSENPRHLKIVYNKLLGGWYIVRGPSHFPLGGPHPSKEHAKQWLEERKQLREERASKYFGRNPRGVPSGAVKIYDQIEQIKATKGARSLYPGERFYHNFQGGSKGQVYGLRDGSLLIKGGRPLWAQFEQGRQSNPLKLRSAPGGYEAFSTTSGNAVGPTFATKEEVKEWYTENKRRLKASESRRLREQAYKDLGMVKVRGALGGTYYE